MLASAERVLGLDAVISGDESRLIRVDCEYHRVAHVAAEHKAVLEVNNEDGCGGAGGTLAVVQSSHLAMYALERARESVGHVVECVLAAVWRLCQHSISDDVENLAGTQ